MFKHYFFYAALILCVLACLPVHAESPLFDDPVPKYEGHGPTRLVPLWPIYYYKKYTSKAAYRKHILWPLYTRTVTPQQTATQILSFQNKYPLSFSKHFYVLWPLSGFQSDPEFGYNDWIFPILWQSNVKDAGRQNVVFPLYWYYKQDDSKSNVLNILLLNHNYWGPGYHNHMLLPIAWTKWGQKRGFNGYSHLLFPLFYANRDEELAEGKFGTNMHTVYERAFLTLFYRWYKDKIAPEGLAQVRNIGLFPISFYKNENYLYYANGNILRNKIFFLFPYFFTARHHVVRPDKTPTNFQELAEDPGFQVLDRKLDLYLPLYLRVSGSEVTDAPHDLKDVKQIPTEYDYRWYFPYYSTFNREPVRSLSSQNIPIPDDEVQNIFMVSRNQDNLDVFTRRAAGIPLIYHKHRKTWTEGRSPKIIVDQRTFYLFPYFSRYAKNKNAEGKHSSFLLLMGWGGADLKIPDFPGYSEKHSYAFPFYYKNHRHSIGAVPFSLDDTESSNFWLFPYYHSTKRVGKSIGRTYNIIPFAYGAEEENTHSNWWYGLLAGKFERQIPLQSKYDSNKYPVTIYEDEDPLDFTRKMSFIIPVWYSKYNLNSARWLLFPFYGIAHSTPKDETATKTTTIPIALARFKTNENADGSIEKRGFAAAYLYYKSSYSAPGQNGKPQSSYWHLIPFYAKTVTPHHKRLTVAIPPYSTDHVTLPMDNGNVIETRSLASPHRWLPIFRSRRQTTTHPEGTRDSAFYGNWLFPFYSIYRNYIERNNRTTVGGGLIYYNHLLDGMQNQLILLGAAATNKTDPYGFGSHTAFFGLYGNEHRSWKHKIRFFPFYSKTSNEDFTSEWSILCGMFGEKDTQTEHVKRIFFYPRVTKKPPQEALPDEALLDYMRSQKDRHLVLAKYYAEKHYPEYAAVEFLLADGEYEDNVQMLRLAADQFAILDPEKLEQLLKRVPPQLLSRTPAFSPETFITYYPDEIYSKSTELYYKLLTYGEDFNSTALALALVCYKFEKYEQCFDILRQRYDKTQEKSDALDLLHFYMAYVEKHQRNNHVKPHIPFTNEIMEKFPGDPLIEFFHAQQELSPIQMAYLDDIGIPKFLKVLELNGENLLPSPKDRHQVLPLPPWPAPFDHVDPNGFPTFHEIVRATHNEIAMCYQRKLQQLRPDIFGTIVNSAIYVPDTPHTKEMKRKQKLMTEEERLAQTINFINNIMLHLSQGTDFEPFRKTLESTELYPCRSIQSQVMQALKHDYEVDLANNHFIPRKAQLDELNKILWKTSFDISFLRNWNVKLVQGPPSDKGNGPLDIVANPDGFVDIDYAFNGIDHCTAEATIRFHNYFARKLTLHLGFDHTLTIEMNGHPVFGPSSQHIARRDQEAVELNVPEGDITLKFIIKDDILNYGFFARFTDEQGMPFFFNDLHQQNCNRCGDQVEKWIQAITPQIKAPLHVSQ